LNDKEAWMRTCDRGWTGWLTLALLTAAPAAAELRFGTPGEHFVSIRGRVQLRYTGVDQSGADENSFLMRRLRLTVEGDALPKVGYEFELSGETADGSLPDRARVLDANVVFKHYPWTQVKAGQFKAPFGAEQINSSARLRAIERALAAALTPERHLGVMVGSVSDNQDIVRGLVAHKVDYAVGYFSGKQIQGPADDLHDSSGFFAGRVVTAPHSRLSLGANFLTSKNSAGSASQRVGLALPGRRNNFGFDVYANQGPFSLWAEFVELRFNPEGGEDPRRLRGFYLHPSLTLIKDRLEVWYRYDAFDPNRDVEDNLDKQWHHLGATYFFRNHDLKLQGEYVARREKGRELEDDVLLVQLQLIW
jgi:phosphate-selective porin